MILDIFLMNANCQITEQRPYREEPVLRKPIQHLQTLCQTLTSRSKNEKMKKGKKNDGGSSCYGFSSTPELKAIWNHDKHSWLPRNRVRE